MQFNSVLDIISGRGCKFGEEARGRLLHSPFGYVNALVYNTVFRLKVQQQLFDDYFSEIQGKTSSDMKVDGIAFSKTNENRCKAHLIAI